LAKAKRKEKELTPKAKAHGTRTVKTMSNPIEDKVDKKELEKRCQQLQKEREEMWERLGMNWRKGTCLPNPKHVWDKTSYSLQ
jgi:hypothetical protein